MREKERERIKTCGMAKIVVVGSCMIDFTCFSPRLPKPGETIVGTRFEKNYGGKGANQCVTAAKLGGSTALIASLGSDPFAQEYLEIFRKENVDASRVKIQSDKHSGVAHIVVAENGENSIVIVLGANESLTPEHVDSAADMIKSASILLCQFEVPLESTLRALKLHQGHGGSYDGHSPRRPVECAASRGRASGQGMQRDHPYSRAARSCVCVESEQKRHADFYCRGPPCRYYQIQAGNSFATIPSDGKRVLVEIYMC
ncbi:ribokinase isoform X4 [Temnothorax americanus]|uniref:ribokinase isoform X4 n=1 Tax=Temnothorax americanus TaxID=1964332 RepID=UPI0040682E63